VTAKPRTGSKYTYDAPGGLGAQVADNQHPEMADLDLHPGTEVKVCGYDDERDLVLVEWVDRQGNPRITSVEPDHFSDAFSKGA
jgi:hypothetical protein